MKKKLAAILLVAALALVPALAKAENDVWVTSMVRAWHSDRTKGYNENTPGIGLEWQPTETPLRWGVGTYKNSFLRQSHYFGITYLPWEWKGVKVGIQAGAVSGYERYDYKFGPAAAIVLAYEKERVGFQTLVIPPIPGDKSPTVVLGFQLKYKVK